MTGENIHEKPFTIQAADFQPAGSCSMRGLVCDKVLQFFVFSGKSFVSENRSYGMGYKYPCLYPQWILNVNIG